MLIVSESLALLPCVGTETASNTKQSWLQNSGRPMSMGFLRTPLDSRHTQILLNDVLTGNGHQHFDVGIEILSPHRAKCLERVVFANIAGFLSESKPESTDAKVSTVEERCSVVPKV